RAFIRSEPARQYSQEVRPSDGSISVGSGISSEAREGRKDMTLRRMDNVLIVVDDLEAVKAFFIELGLKLEGETTVEGPSVGSLIGLKDVRATLAMMRTPGREEAETRAATVPHWAECAVQRSRPPSP